MQFVGLDFDERQVGLGVSADDATLKFAVVVKFYEQFVGILHHVVVSYDVAVGREYHARAGTLPLRSLDLALLLAAAAPMIDSLQAGHRLVREISPQWSSLFRPSVQPYLISWFGYDPVQLIARVACPVLVVQGDKDLQVSLADADSLCAARPSARRAVIRGMNHVLKQTDTLDRQAQLIKTYMDPTLPLHPEFVPLVAAFVRTVARP